MKIDATAATDFVTSHARLLDRRRLGLRQGSSDPDAALAALGAYRNSDGGFGAGLEPDLRSPESQPAAAHHAFEVLEEIAPTTSPYALALCDWLDSISHEDGGLPFALPLTTAAGSGPWWQSADPAESSLQITSLVAGSAQRVAGHDAAVASHPWLERATAYCLSAIEAMEEPIFAYVLGFSLRFLDAIHDSRPDQADALLERLARFVPADGKVPVRGGAEGETLHPLDIAPRPDDLARRLFSDGQIAADLDRLASLQQPDGGWVVDFPSASPAAAIEWRGYATVRALDVLGAARVV